MTLGALLNDRATVLNTKTMVGQPCIDWSVETSCSTETGVLTLRNMPKNVHAANRFSILLTLVKCKCQLPVRFASIGLNFQGRDIVNQ